MTDSDWAKPDPFRAREVAALESIARSLAVLASPPPDATAPKTRLVWYVAETDAFGKTTGWRHYLHLADAMETARRWVAQSAGDVTISRREVPANA